MISFCVFQNHAVAHILATFPILHQHAVNIATNQDQQKYGLCIFYTFFQCICNVFILAQLSFNLSKVQITQQTCGNMKRLKALMSAK